MKKKAKLMPSQQELREWFDYKNGELYWNKSPNLKNPKIVGCKAGTLFTSKNKKYIRVKLKNNLYYVHRIIWSWHGGNLEPNQDIDHIDGNGLNNNINNLRVCTHKQNGENRKSANKNSKSGIRGVAWHKKAKKWIAQIMHNSEYKYLGLYDTLEEAEKVVVTKRKELFTHSND